ncbi:transposase family protein [Mycobacterium ulcerans str. Harvey]|uniref:Transposase family protein n=1 Tax=Mycobacterium ulcerans str. Harvey TaxID=1299332 RepID=A0ABN0QWN3_MYCUL|nr:transposase family protein [Mycobacterium ulcerans str. Harvey]
MTWMRQHCGIENSLHWIRDVTFDEDRHRHIPTRRTGPSNATQHRDQSAPPQRRRHIAEACRITALTANRRLDLLNPHSPACYQQRRALHGVRDASGGESVRSAGCGGGELWIEEV